MFYDAADADEVDFKVKTGRRWQWVLSSHYSTKAVCEGPETVSCEHENSFEKKSLL